MKILSTVLISTFAVLALACEKDDDDSGSDGGSDAGSDTGSDSGAETGDGELLFSCDYVKDGAHLLCSDTEYPASLAEIIEMSKEQCGMTDEPGAVENLGEGCDTSDAVGGCRTVDAGAPGVTITTWSYTGTVDQVMAGCAPEATFVLPP